MKNALHGTLARNETPISAGPCRVGIWYERVGGLLLKGNLNNNWKGAKFHLLLTHR
jgi:hypothetical protein